MNNIACVCSPGQGCFRGGETCDNLGGLRGAEGGGGAIATWGCGQVLRILCSYLHIPRSSAVTAS